MIEKMPEIKQASESENEDIAKKRKFFVNNLQKAEKNASQESTYYDETMEDITEKIFLRHETMKSHISTDNSLLVDNPDDFRLALKII